MTNRPGWLRPLIHKKAKEAKDARWQKLSGMLWYLRELESKDGGNAKAHKKLFTDILETLMKRKDFVGDADFWTELYLRSIWQLPSFKKIPDTNIPATIAVKHNHVLPFYMKHMPKISKRAPILHWDTHDDINPIENSANLPGNQKLQEAQDIVWDIGAAMSGVIIATGPRPFLWCMPSWVPNPSLACKYDLVHTKSKNSIDMVVQQPESEKLTRAVRTTSLRVVPQTKDMESGNYAQVQMESLPDANRRLLQLIGNEKEYVLDVDLDFFCCNGKKLDKQEFFKEPYDVASHHRIPRIEMIRTPRDVYDPTDKVYIMYAKMVNKELKLIRKRLAGFQNTLRYLKKNGKTPVLVSISDSTKANFTECIDCSSTCNSYVPGHIALWLRMQVIDIISKTYSQHRP